MSAKPARHWKIGLLWHSITSDNLGVGALTLSQMALIERAVRKRGDQCSFHVVGTRGGTTYPITEYRIDGSAEFALRAFKAMDFSGITLLRQCDVVFDIGEGDSFADIYGNKRLFMQTLSKALCRMFGKPLILSPQTIGPFNTPLGRRMGKLGLACATRVYARDNISLKYIQELGYGHMADEVIDVAFALPFNKSERAVEEAGRLKIGINVSGLMTHASKDFKFTLDYRDLIDRACKLLTERADCDVYLVPHVICDAALIEDDLRASQELVRRFPTLRLAPRFRTPSEAKSFISGLDLLTGARMHACIAAISSGVPVLPMAYSRKFNGLFSSLGYPHLIDCLRQSTDEALQALEGALDKLPEMREDVRRSQQIAAAKVDRYLDEISHLLDKS